MKTKSIVIGIAIFLLGFVVSGSLKPRQAALAPTSTPMRHYAMNVVYSGWPGWVATREALDELSAKIPGLQTSFGGPLSGDAGKQIEELDPLIERKVNGIILFASDAKGMSATVNKAASNGIPVVTIYGDTADSKRLTFISADERGSARRLAKKVSEKIKGKFSDNVPAKVLLCTGRVGIESHDQRLQGLKDALATTPWMRLVEMVSDDVDDAKATEVISAAWGKNNGLDVIMGVDPRAAIGAIAALKERQKKPGEVLITGWDNDDDVLRGIKDGWIEATSVPNFTYMTQLAVSILDAHNLGYLAPPPQRIEIEQNYINKENVDMYLKKTGVSPAAEVGF